MTNREEIKQLVRAALEQSMNVGQAGQPPAAPAVEYRAPWTGVDYEVHPSRQQFNINEASELKANLLEFVEAQLCTIERNRKCDHCGVCKSLGF